MSQKQVAKAIRRQQRATQNRKAAADNEMQRIWHDKKVKIATERILLEAAKEYLKRVAQQHKLSEAEAVHVLAKLLPLMPVVAPRQALTTDVPPPVDNIPASKKSPPVSSGSGFSRSAWGQQ